MIDTVCSAPFFILYLSESTELAKNTDQVPGSEWDCCIPLEAGGTGKITRMCFYYFLSVFLLIWRSVNTLTFSSGAGNTGDAVCSNH